MSFHLYGLQHIFNPFKALKCRPLKLVNPTEQEYSTKTLEIDLCKASLPWNFPCVQISIVHALLVLKIDRNRIIKDILKYHETNHSNLICEYFISSITFSGML